MSKPSFKTPLVVSPLPDGRKWRLVFSFQYITKALPVKVLISIEAGFETDFASVPFFAWWLIPKWGKYGKAAVIHDALYQRQSVSRKQADDVFREAMVLSGVAPWRLFLIYWAVRAFGWLAWKKRR